MQRAITVHHRHKERKSKIAQRPTGLLAPQLAPASVAPLSIIPGLTTLRLNARYVSLLYSCGAAQDCVRNCHCIAVTRNQS